jgi:hypothetical protein
VATEPANRLFRVKQLPDRFVSVANATVIHAAGPLQAALAASTAWMDVAGNPYVIEVERLIERTYVVLVAWDVGGQDIRQRFAVTPVAGDGSDDWVPINPSL